MRVVGGDVDQFSRFGFSIKQSAGGAYYEAARFVWKANQEAVLKEDVVGEQLGSTVHEDRPSFEAQILLLRLCRASTSIKHGIVQPNDTLPSSPISDACSSCDVTGTMLVERNP